MKKVFLTLSVMLAFVMTACNSMTPTDKTQEKIRQETNKRIGSHITKFDFEGHTYLLYEYCSQQNSRAGLVHDPNCQCEFICECDE